MQFQIGNEVVFLREPGGGIITKIEGHIIYVEDETGFDRPFKADNLGKVHSKEFHVPEDTSALLQLADVSDNKNTSKSKVFSTHKDHWEIDLHYEDLIEIYGDKLSKNQDQALLRQMAVFKEFYYKARNKKVRKLIVIHGFGKGILREELHTFLKGQEGVDFFDAPYTEYGHGATQVEIRYRF